jgi:hypothetical protein
MNITPHVVKQLLKKHGFVERKMQKAVTNLKLYFNHSLACAWITFRAAGLFG